MPAPHGPAPASVSHPTGLQPDAPRPDPVFPEARLLVRSWHDPVLDNLGHDPRSPYVEQFWLAVLGPSCLLFVRRLAARLEREPDGFELDPLQWARELGLGMKGGKHGPFWRAVDRSCRFQLAQRNGELLVVRRRMAPLTTRQVKRLPENLQAAHERWLDAQRRRPQRRSLTTWTVDRAESDVAPAEQVLTEFGEAKLSERNMSPGDRSPHDADVAPAEQVVAGGQ